MRWSTSDNVGADVDRFAVCIPDVVIKSYLRGLFFADSCIKSNKHLDFDDISTIIVCYEDSNCR